MIVRSRSPSTRSERPQSVTRRSGSRPGSRSRGSGTSRRAGTEASVASVTRSTSAAGASIVVRSGIERATVPGVGSNVASPGHVSAQTMPSRSQSSAFQGWRSVAGAIPLARACSRLTENRPPAARSPPRRPNRPSRSRSAARRSPGRCSPATAPCGRGCPARGGWPRGSCARRRASPAMTSIAPGIGLGGEHEVGGVSLGDAFRELLGGKVVDRPSELPLVGRA